MARGVGRGMKKKNEAGKGSNIESIKIEKRDRGERMRKTIYDDDCVRVCVKYIYIYIYTCTMNAVWKGGATIVVDGCWLLLRSDYKRRGEFNSTIPWHREHY